MKYLPKKGFLIIIHRNSTHILDMSCCHKHHQKKYNNEKTKISIFLHYMYVDILFPLTKAIPIMYVTTYYQTLKTWIGHNAMRYHKITRYHKRYHTLSLSFTWIGHNATCYHNFNELPHALPYIFSQCTMVWGYLQGCLFGAIYKKYINKFEKMMVTNTLQVAQNQGNLRENIPSGVW